VLFREVHSFGEQWEGHEMNVIDFALAAVLWNKSKHLRNCVRIGKLTKSEEEVNL
jgi:hypothetical protein